MFFHISVAEYKIRYLCMAFSDLCKTAKATFRLKKPIKNKMLKTQM